MAYFKINNIDLSMYVSGLKVGVDHNYTAQTNAAGDSVVDYINSKRTIEVNVIALDSSVMPTIQELIALFNVSLSFRDPLTNELIEGINCIVPSNEVEYYTIQAGNVMYKAFTLTFTEL